MTPAPPSPTARDRLPASAEAQIEALVEHALTADTWFARRARKVVTEATSTLETDVREFAALRLTNAARGGWLPRAVDSPDGLLPAWLVREGWVDLGPWDCWPEVLGWLTAVAAAPDDQWALMAHVFHESDRKADAAGDAVRVLAAVAWSADAAAILTPWRDSEPFPLAGLCYAAGLSAAEARALQRTDGLDVDRLAVLAGLRGWRLPSLP